MRLKKPSVEKLHVLGRFQTLRKRLTSAECSDRLQRPLAYWVLPRDRCLPLSLLDRTLAELLETPFNQISATPGVGQKKIATLIELLDRAAEAENGTPEAVDSISESTPAAERPTDGAFDPNTVSEAVWASWRESVVRHDLQDERLGRLASSLQDMTRVIWNRPLSDYVDATLAEIRARRTHGEKRVRAVLDVFHNVHAMVSSTGAPTHLVVRIAPGRIDRVERWIGSALQTPGLPSESELYDRFIEPLLDQVRCDAPEQVAQLADRRLGVDGPMVSVRQAARLTGLTRARVYQLLNEINDVMTVRWPCGRHLAYELRDKLRSEAEQTPSPPDLRRFESAVELFYPGARRGAAGPLEQAFPMDLAPLEEAETQAVA